MKSIMEAATSLTKAIENGWQRAGKPQEFTVKILQKPQKNFFGFTTESAKIAIVFDEKHVASPTIKKESSAQKRTKKQTTPAPEAKRPNNKRTAQKIWTEERISFAKQWISDMLSHIERKDVTFQTRIDRSAIRFTFDKPIASNNEKERQIFRSWAHLLIQTIKHTYKQQFKSIKVVLKSS